MRSIGLDLQPWVDNGLLLFHASRPTLHGLERHLVTMYKIIREFQPRVVVIDPITNFLSVGGEEEVKSMLMRLIDFLKLNQVTAIFNSLIHGEFTEQTDVGVSSLMDVWLLRRMSSAASQRRTTSESPAGPRPHREVLLTGRGSTWWLLTWVRGGAHRRARRRRAKEGPRRLPARRGSAPRREMERTREAGGPLEAPLEFEAGQRNRGITPRKSPRGGALGTGRHG